MRSSASRFYSQGTRGNFGTSAHTTRLLLVLFAISLLRRRLAPDDCWPAGDPILSARWLTLDGGERVRVVEGGDPAAPLVLFLHGWGASAYFYRFVLPMAVAAGRRVAAMDLRGHGWSDKPTDESRYSAEAMSDQVLAVLDLLQPGRGAGDRRGVDVVAHSLGGGVALDVARRAPARVASLALLAPVGLAPVRFVPLARFATPSLAAPLVRFAVPPWTAPVAMRAVNGTLGGFALRDLDEYWAPTREAAFGGALRALLHRFRLDPRTDGELSAISARVLVLLGGQDLLVRGAESAARVRGRRGWTARVYPRVGHVLAEEVPGVVMEELLEFWGAGAGGVG
jgi:pimeloyl-ACP methyl ester carboxylesterase